MMHPFCAPLLVPVSYWVQQYTLRDVRPKEDHKQGGVLAHWFTPLYRETVWALDRHRMYIQRRYYIPYVHRRQGLVAAQMGIKREGEDDISPFCPDRAAPLTYSSIYCCSQPLPTWLSRPSNFSALAP